MEVLAEPGAEIKVLRITLWQCEQETELKCSSMVGGFIIIFDFNGIEYLGQG